MTFTCISSGNIIHRNIFSYEKRKRWQAGQLCSTQNSSYENHTSYCVKINNLKNASKNGRTMYTHYLLPLFSKKTFYIRTTFICIPSGNCIHHNIFSYEKRKDSKQEFKWNVIWKTHQLCQKQNISYEIHKFLYENQETENTVTHINMKKG